ncbi:dsDNA nuclease domain-containing protein [Sphingomonas pituitosa]|uniref:dsDNA nuclease domain-containing protein n=1 Tax=Sphingomonas pituitosa TaxID=99597 RepID=UPI000AE9D6A6|nr:dsDNA nuclease domain-containing protein [Sphingomonas pituitosa]
MSLIKDLLTVPEREDGGRTAYDRFDYQTAWGLARLLELHSKGENYAVAFEFHDDIVALDDANNPTSATFYQVKTKDKGNWTLAELSRRDKAKDGFKPSFAGRMFDNVGRFGTAVTKLSLVSNQPLSIATETHGEASFSKVNSTKLESFLKALKAEAATFDPLSHISLFYFVYSDLTLTSFDSTIHGKISEFLQDEVGPEVPPRPFALLLNDHCRKRARRLTDLGDFKDLKASKFITRDQMLTWLVDLKSDHIRRPEWSNVSSELSLPFDQRHRIRKAWQDYEVQLRSRPNAATIAFSKRVRSLVNELTEGASSYEDVLSRATPVVRSLVTEWRENATEDFVHAVILYEFER